HKIPLDDVGLILGRGLGGGGLRTLPYQGLGGRGPGGGLDLPWLGTGLDVGLRRQAGRGGRGGGRGWDLLLGRGGGGRAQRRGGGRRGDPQIGDEGDPEPRQRPQREA